MAMRLPRVLLFSFRCYKRYSLLNAVLLFLVLITVILNDDHNAQEDQNPLKRRNCILSNRVSQQDLRVAGNLPRFPDEGDKKSSVPYKVNPGSEIQATERKKPPSDEGDQEVAAVGISTEVSMSQQKVMNDRITGSDHVSHTPANETAKAQKSSVTEPNLQRDLPFDLHRRSWTLWPKVRECRLHQIQFLKPGSMPMTALASYPGSGNSWLRYLIEAASGIFTGSQYTDNFLLKAGFLGETEAVSSGATVVQKAHKYNKETLDQFGGRAILLLRNPFEAVLAYHNFLFGAHKLYAPVIHYRKRDWDSFLHLQLKSWLETLIRWLNKGTSILVVHFENLKRNPMDKTLKVLHFLGLTPNSTRIACLKDAPDGHMHRKPQYITWDITVFPNQTRNKFDRAIRYAIYLLQKYNKDPPPVDQYYFYNRSLPEKFIRVQCAEDETKAGCDARVDFMNSKLGSNFYIGGRTGDVGVLINSPGILDLGMKEGIQGPKELMVNKSSAKQTEQRSDAVTKGSGAINETDRYIHKDTKKKLKDSGIGALAGTLLQKMAGSIVNDPAVQLMKDPKRKEFLSRPIHFDGAQGPDAEQLARDFNWVLHGRNKLTL